MIKCRQSNMNLYHSLSVGIGCEQSRCCPISVRGFEYKCTSSSVSWIRKIRRLRRGLLQLYGQLGCFSRNDNDVRYGLVSKSAGSRGNLIYAGSDVLEQDGTAGAGSPMGKFITRNSASESTAP